MKKGKLLFEVKPHSFVDIITNSSSEIFCSVKAKGKDVLYSALSAILEEFGCDAVSFSVYEAEDEKGNTIEGVYGIWYDYEINHEPCRAIKEKIKEKFEIYKQYTD